MTNAGPRQPFANTARWIAAARARESRRPDSLFVDPFAGLLAGEAGHALLARSESASGGENGFLAVRTRYFDDTLLGSMRAGGQVVLLGAGFDVRAYRLPFAADTHAFEIDGAELLAEKEDSLARSGATPCCARSVVAADLRGDWGAALQRAGHELTRPTVWIAEGVLFYLAESAVVNVLKQARAHSAPESFFLADVFGSGLLTQPSLQPYLRWLKQAALPAPFCVDQPRALFSRCGWRPVSITQPGAEDANYGRFPPPALKMPPEDAGTNRAYLIRATAAGEEPPA